MTTSNYRLNIAIVQADRDAQIALAALTDYQPANAAFSAANIATAVAEVDAAHEAEVLAEFALDAARDAAAAAERRLHEGILGAKEQVIAQYGINSDQMHSLGLKKKSEYKRPSRSAPEPDPEPAP